MDSYLQRESAAAVYLRVDPRRHLFCFKFDVLSSTRFAAIALYFIKLVRNLLTHPFSQNLFPCTISHCAVFTHNARLLLGNCYCDRSKKKKIKISCAPRQQNRFFQGSEGKPFPPAQHCRLMFTLLLNLHLFTYACEWYQHLGYYCCAAFTGAFLQYLLIILSTRCVHG